MYKSGKIKLYLLVILSMFLIPAWGMWTEAKAKTKVPTRVNYVDYNDINDVPNDVKERTKGAIKRANEIYNDANADVELDHVDSGTVTVGDGDGSVDINERGSLRRSGPNELNNSYGECNGVKVNMVNHIDRDPPTNGIAVRGSKVIIVDVNRIDVNSIGRTIAHEMMHDIAELGDLNGVNDVNYLRYGTSAGGTAMSPNDINALQGGAAGRGQTVVAHIVVPGAGLGVKSGIVQTVGDARGARHDGLEDVVCVNPLHLDPAFNYADMHLIKMFCGNPATPGSTTSLRLHLDGPFPEIEPFTAEYHVSINNDADAEEDVHITMTVQRLALYDPIITSAWYENFDLGDSYPLEPPPIAETLYEQVEEGLGEPVNAYVLQEVHTEMISMDLTGVNPIEVTVSSTVQDPRVMDPMLDEADTFTFGLSLHAGAPVISVIEPGEGAMGIGYGIAGSGFSGIGEVVIEIDDEVVGTATVAGDGSFVHFLDMAFDMTGQHDVSVYPPRGSVIPKGRAVSGSATIAVCDEGPLDGDLNYDCTVDLIDFSLFALDYLRGTPIP